MKIKLTSFFDMNCLEATIANYALTYHRDYQMMFAHSWGFNYSNDKEKIGERISSNEKIDLEYLKHYHGIEITETYADSKTELINSICNHIKNKVPIIIFISNYYYPWNEHYHKFDNGLPHALLIVDVDLKKQLFFCVDSKFMQKNGQISFQDVNDGASTKYWSLKLLENYVTEISTQEVLKYSLAGFTSNKGTLTPYQYIDNIFLFSEQLKYNFDRKKELDGTHGGIWIEPIIFNISNVIAGRCNYERMLTYIIEHNTDRTLDPILLAAKKNFSLIISNWRQVRGLIVKTKYINNIDDLYIRIGDRVNRIANLELETINILLSTEIEEQHFESLPVTAPNENMLINKQFSHILFVPLEHLFNYQRFFNANDSQSLKSVGGLKYFFHVDPSLKKEIWEHNTFKFFHVAFDGYGLDSIACSGTDIQIKPNSYDEIMFMLHSELNAREDEFIIHYSDGTSENYPLVIPHSSSKKDIIWTGQWGYTTNLTETYLGNIYAISIRLKKKKFHSISLPNCPNIIIFAISLGIY